MVEGWNAEERKQIEESGLRVCVSEGERKGGG